MMNRRELLALTAAPALAQKPALRVAVFEADITPPLGTPLCVGLVPVGSSVTDPLRARGVVLLPSGQKPVVLCALDWLGIGNGGYDRWRAGLAKAAGTSIDRVAVHTVHQHDAPGDDATAEALLGVKGGVSPLQSERFARAAVAKVMAAVKAAKAVEVTEVSAGAAQVDRIASNRRIMAEGKVIFGRMTACRNSPYCEAPEGVIDPELKSVSFWNGAKRVVTLSYYATHPMSHYGKGVISADFVGMARDEQKDTFQIHFTGAAGNIGAGRYNTGAPENRAVLAGRLSQAMRQAKEKEVKFRGEAVRWQVKPVALPVREGKGFSEEEIVATLTSPQSDGKQRANAARFLAWLRLAKAGRKIDIGALHVGSAHIVHMPGELFVEYQLAAIRERAGETVAMAAYGDYGPMYIGTRRAYDEGGYEVSHVSRVGPGVEDVLSAAVREVVRG